MADDIQVRFGDDAGGIRTAADQAKGTVQSFATAARGRNAATYERIGATLTGNVFSVIQGQTTIAQAAHSTALSIVQSYVQARVKLIADWLAGVSAHQAGEAAKTAAATAGAAASFATQAGAIPWRLAGPSSPTRPTSAGFRSCQHPKPLFSGRGFRSLGRLSP